MMRTMRLGAILGLAILAVTLAPLLAGPAEAAPCAQVRARIAVAVFPDLYGVTAEGEACGGCDGEYTAEDTEANADDPLGVLEVALLDADGKEIDRNRTSGLANGRQVTFFSVEGADRYTVRVERLGEAWQACPESDLEVVLEPADFDATTGFASVSLYVWRGCGEDAVAEAVSTEAVTETVAADMGQMEAPTTEAEDAPAEGTAAVTETAATGVIRGVAFVDADADGTLDGGEGGLPGAVVRLVGLGESRQTETAGAGTYAFGNLVAGSYDVYLDVPEGYEATTPDRYVGLRVDSGALMGIDFGLSGVAPEGPATDTVGETTAVTETVVVTLTSEVEAETPALPSTGVEFQPRGRALAGLAMAVGVLGALGLALEAGRGRRTNPTAEGGDDV